MKKLFLGLTAAALMASAVSAQVLPAAGVENNLWTGFGSPFSGDAKYYGVIDCLQARVDIAQFTIEGMLNWGAIAVWDGNSLNNLVFTNTETNPLNRHYHNESANNVSDEALAAWFIKSGVMASNRIMSRTIQDSYYVNFLWHAGNGLDVGMGTKLNWQVGPAPRYGAWLWEPDAHLRQGGFSTAYDDRSGSVGMYQYHATDAGNRPGTADVVGFVPYANKYAKKAIGLRYVYDGDFGFQIGGAIPDGTDSDHPRMNLGIAITPVEWLNIATAYEGLFQKDGNFYAGVTLGARTFILDAYFAWDSIDTDNGKDDPKDMAFGTGAGITFAFPKVGISLRPEAGFNWFENTDFTPAWYAGGLFKWDFTERMSIQAWTSFAVGSKDKTWSDTEQTKDWNGGHIFNVRPEFTFKLDNHNAVSAYVNLENRASFDGKARDCWSAGAFWTYKLNTGKVAVKR